MFHRLSRHLEFRKRYSIARSIFTVHSWYLDIRMKDCVSCMILRPLLVSFMPVCLIWFQSHQMALIIPYRNRFEQLSIFVRHMHPILRRQNLDYRIFVIEQVLSMNGYLSVNYFYSTWVKSYQRISPLNINACIFNKTGGKKIRMIVWLSLIVGGYTPIITYRVSVSWSTV